MGGGASPSAAPDYRASPLLLREPHGVGERASGIPARGAVTVAAAANAASTSD
uniref:Uncharacterized protein n=1 Tax=Arundo donax TaxID=35708 RepID=A0A0A8YZS7_ARUDO